MTGVLEGEMIRAGWRRARRATHMVDLACPEFGRGGLPPFAQAVNVRLLILPADPDGTWLPFDDDFWGWWKGDHTDPHTGGAATFDRDQVSMSNAAVLGRGGRRGGECDRYLLLRRDGALELGLGRDARYIQPVNGKEHLTGPWEVSLALFETAGSLLAGFATGWRGELYDLLDNPRCSEAAILLRRELDRWLGGDAFKGLAYDFGDQLEQGRGTTNKPR